MLKKLVSLLLLVTLVTSFMAGCGKQEEKAEKQSSETNSADTSSETNTEDTITTSDEPEVVETFTMFASDPNTNYEDFMSPVAQKITEKTGVKLDIEYPVGELASKIGIMIASGDYPDLIFAKGTEYDQLVEAGALIDLTELIEQYGPNIKKLYGKYMNRLKFTQEDPGIYSLSCREVNPTKWNVNAGFELQHAVVQELGYPKLETLQDYENAIKAYIEKYPTIDGQPTIGLSLLADDWRWLITLGNPGAFATGAPDDGQWYIDPVTYEATYHFLRPEEKEFYRWLNHMNDIGLLDPDSFVQKYDAYIAKIASGRVLGLIDAKWEYDSAQNALKTEGKFERTYGQYPIQVDPTKTKAAEFRNSGFSGGYGVGITVNCEDPVKVIKFLDWMASEEGQILRNWGIEGVNYTIDADGKRVISAEEWDKKINNATSYAKETGVGVYVYPFPVYGQGVVDSTGNTYSTVTPESIINTFSEIEKEVLTAYDATMWYELYPKKEDMLESAWGAAWMITIPDKTGISVTQSKCDDIVQQGLVASIISSPDKFDAIYDQMIEELKDVGVEEMNAKFTELVKAQIQKWK